MLFGKLPNEIFRPLSGPNRHIIEKVLKQLHVLFFDDENPATDSPRRDIVLDRIHQVLIMEDQLLLLDEEDQGGAIYNTPAAAADYILRRLVNTGWLEWEEDGYNTNVTPNPNATLLLEALIDIERREKKSYGRVVLSILGHIEQALNHPKDRGLVFLDAVAQTREFSSHLRGILYSLKEVQDLLAKIKDPREVLANFFEEFVERILVADYKTLNSADNPFRFRQRILQHLQFMEYSDIHITTLVGHYQDHYNIDGDEASIRLKRDMEFIMRIFRSVDRRLEKIDSFCFRLENRVAETVRFIDRTMPGISQRMIDLLRTLGENLNEHEDLPTPVRANLQQTVSQFSIYSPHGRKEKPTVQVLRSRELSPEARKKKEIVREYMKRRAYEPLRVVNYLDQQMGDRTVMSAAEFSIQTVEDLISFLLIRRLPRMLGKGQVRAKEFHIQRRPEQIETEWATIPNFTVERRLNVN
ncbi:DUF5716 family protein [Desulfuromonas carbonis]